MLVYRVLLRIRASDNRLLLFSFTSQSLKVSRTLLSPGGTSKGNTPIALGGCNRCNDRARIEVVLQLLYNLSGPSSPIRDFSSGTAKDVSRVRSLEADGILMRRQDDRIRSVEEDLRD